MDLEAPAGDRHRSLALIVALHLAGLWNLGVVQPIFDVVAANPEFFVAHRTRGIDLVGLVVLLCVLGPLCGILPTLIASAVGRRSGLVVTWVVVAALLAVIALPVVKRSWDLDASMTFSVAIAVGAGVAFCYIVFAPVRLFASFLSLATVVVPVVFLLQPTIAGLLWAEEHEPLAGVELTPSPPPVVMVVFDQLPLPSLLDREGAIDAVLYPNFASLAGDATWFRQASAVADLTHFAVPAVLTGNYPEPELLPATADHPNNLFTLLGSAYRVEAFEPLTRLCPETVCPPARPPLVVWYGSVLLDLSVVYQHIVLPDELTAALPPVTQNWKDFAASDTWRSRWSQRRRTDRRDEVHQFIESIEASVPNDPPPLHFLHVLLPHEPWVYLPTGQRFATAGDTVGLDREGRWTEDDLAVARNYQRHLLQARFADRLLGQVIDRLRAVGLYDDAVVVVTADHGGSFRPGVPFRRPRRGTFVDIAAIPLLIKAPGQRAGRVNESNVETTDVVPTLAALLGADLPWEADGRDALGPAIRDRARKRLLFDNAKQQIVGPRRYEQALQRVVARKYRWFKQPDGFHQPQLGPYRGLVGRRVDGFQIAAMADLRAAVDSPGLFSNVDHDGDFLPGRVTGTFPTGDTGVEAGADTWLGVAVNGVLAGVTRPYAFRVAGRQNFWELIIDPQLFRNGANTLEVFVVDRSGDGEVVLKRAYASGDVPPDTNLIRQEAEVLSGVTSTGFYRTEWAGQEPLRWTGERATLVAPVDRKAPPSELRMVVLMTGPPTKSVRLAVDGCVVFEGEIQGRWEQTFPLRGCRPKGNTVQIRIDTDVHRPGGAKGRELGIGVSAIELLD